MKLLVFLSLIVLSIQSFPCTCGLIQDLEEAQRKSYEDHNLIFLAEPLGPGEEEGTYKLKVLEVLKGTYADSLIIGKYHNSCSEFPIVEDKMWLVYTDYNKKNKLIDIGDCGLSRSLRFPFLLTKKRTDASLPHPPKGGYETLQSEIEHADGRKKALMLLQKEIEMIRRGYK